METKRASVLPLYYSSVDKFLRGLGAVILVSPEAMDEIMKGVSAPGADRVGRNVAKILEKDKSLYEDLAKAIGLYLVSLEENAADWRNRVDFQKAAESNLYHVVYAIYSRGLLGRE